MKQKLYLVLLLLSLTLSGNAEEKWCLVVESTGGETIAIGCDQKPVIKTVADGYELRYGEQVSSFTWSQLKKVTIQETEPTATAIEEVKVEFLKPTFQVSPGEICIKGAEPGSMAQIFSLNGRLQKNARVGDNGSVSLSTRNLPTGVYIIKTNKSTFKIVKK